MNIADFAIQSPTLVATNWAHRQRLLTIIALGDHVRAALWAYYECDADKNGYLDWNTGEIRNFIKSVFWQHGMTHPNEEQMYMMYTHFDSTHKHRLVAMDCVCMVDALLRGCVILEELPAELSSPTHSEVRGPRIIRAQTTHLAGTPGRPYSPTAHAAHPGAQHFAMPLCSPGGQLQVVRAHVHGAVSQPLMGRPVRRLASAA